jgi:hypothetical protein
MGLYLRSHNAVCRDEILDSARKGYKAWWAKEETKGVNLDTAANFSSWIKGYLNPFPNITKPMQFDIRKENGETVVSVRNRCGLHTEPWRGLHSSDEQFTKVFEKSVLTFSRKVCRLSCFYLGL